jgi:N-acetyl-alpha-D-muramate 1-phosphate uridylyltransferase
MEAMILAAGIGTRLQPLTDHTPKALVKVGSRPMLEHVARRLVEAGVDHLVINVHHHADQIIDFLRAVDSFGIRVDVSEEPEQRLETGGGLKHAGHFFEKDQPFFMHNSDVMTGIDLRALYDAHESSGALATLAMRPLETARYLIFDDDGLCGFSSASKHDSEGSDRLVRETRGELVRLDFTGVQVISPRIFDLMTEDGVFSIINVYLRLAREGERIDHFVTDALWIDIGDHDRLEEARRAFTSEQTEK